MPKMDWDKESKGNFPVFPAITLRVRIHSVKRVMSSKKQTPGIQWVGIAVEHPDQMEHVGRFISTTTYLSEASLWRVAMLVEACGISGMPAVETDSEIFLGMCQECIGHTTFWRNEPRMYEGKESNDIVDFQPDPEQAVTEFMRQGDAPDFAKEGQRNEWAGDTGSLVRPRPLNASVGCTGSRPPFPNNL